MLRFRQNRLVTILVTASTRGNSHRPCHSGPRVTSACHGNRPIISPMETEKLKYKRPAVSRRALIKSVVRCGQLKYWPPLAEMVDPVMKPASSDARNTTQRAISSGSPNRPTGICGMIRSFSTFSSMARTMSVPM